VTEQLRLFVVTGEHSGDALGGKLMAALRERRPNIVFGGIGGEAMEEQGLRSLFPISDIAVMGFVPVIARARTLLARISQAVEAALAFRPDMLVIIDSPDFTHRVARRVRAFRPDLPVVDYVSPSVWAWRPGRARAMARYVDHVLALLPFEPAVHAELGGPDCTYVGHPLIERLGELRPSPGERSLPGQGPPRLLLLPGSRAGVVRRHLDLFGQVVERLRREIGEVDLVLPTLPHLAEEIGRHAAGWAIAPRLVLGEAGKLAAFRQAHAALAASGTVTLELALSGVPTIAVYRMDALVTIARPLVPYRRHSVLLPNLILGDNTVPEFIGRPAEPAAVTNALLPLLGHTPERAAQLAGLSRLDALMSLGEEKPSGRAADMVLQTLRQREASHPLR